MQKEAPTEPRRYNLLTHWLSALCFFIALPLFLNTLDSAQVKITLYYMGAIAALGLWISKLYFYKENIFTRQNIIKLLPFILYVGYIFITFFTHPYMMGRAESLFKFLGMCIFFSIIAFEFEKRDVSFLLKAIIGCAWVVSIYGVIQVIDLYVYKGIDKLSWTAAFQKRIFSTIANPNFLGDYCLFSLMVVLVRFFYTHYKRYILLALLLLIDIFFTESKGAWLGVGVSLVIFAGVYLNFFKTKLTKHKKIMNIGALVFFLLCGTLVVHFGSKRMQSVNFRLSTWRSSWDMIQATPLTGMGFGSFQVIYQAYKRPDIFYMENLHNAETQHAENFFIEQWTSLGILGLGLFLYLVFYQLKGAFRAFKLFENDRENAYNLFAALMASSAIYLHNLVDVSIYFVSTMYFLALFNGILFNLAYGRLEKRTSLLKQSNKLKIMGSIMTVIATSIIVSIALYIAYEYRKISLSSNHILLALYWIFFVVAVLGTLFGFLYALWKARKIFVSIVLVLTAGAMFIAFRTLIADHYFNVASSMFARKDPSAGIVYARALSYNPFKSSINQFRGSYFANRFNMTRRFLPLEGDTKPMTDFERADKYYEREINLLSPNNALIWHSRGLLYKKMAMHVGQKDFLEGERYYKLAEEYFKHSLHLDPVYDNTYFQLADIAAAHRDFNTAKIWLHLYMQGPRDVVNEEYLAQHKHNEKAQQYYKIFDEDEKKLKNQNAK